MRKSPHGHCPRDANGGRSPTYRAWQNMVSRCTQPSNPAHAHYKRRGITICERWLKFENFLADMGERPSGTSLDRTNNSGDYEPRNCRWATKIQQANNRITNVHFEWRGKTYTLAELSRASLVSKELLRSRLMRNKSQWTVDGAIRTPPLQKGSRFSC